MQAWREAGIQTPEDLKQAMQERSRKVVIPAIVTQAVLDSSVAAVAFTISSLTSNSGSIFDVIYVVSTGIGLYYTFNAAFGVVTAVGLLGSKAASSSAESDAMMKAVRMLAGEESRIDLISKAQQAINMVKIVRSLNEVQSLLSQKVGDEQQLTSLESLAAYLTLANAEKDLGFDPAKYGLNEGEALKIAAKFARFDSNDDGTLELSEMEQLFRAVCDEKDECLIISFSPEELQAAMDVLDQNNNGAVEFDDFVGWYLAQLPEPPSSAEM